MIPALPQVGGTELLIVLLLFGAKRIPQFAPSGAAQGSSARASPEPTITKTRPQKVLNRAMERRSLFKEAHLPQSTLPMEHRKFRFQGAGRPSLATGSHLCVWRPKDGGPCRKESGRLAVLLAKAHAEIGGGGHNSKGGA